MKIQFLFILALLSTQASAQNSARWQLGLYGQSADDTLSSSKIVGFMGRAKLHHEFSDSFEANIVGQANIETGSSSSLFTDEFAPSNGLSLKEGSLKWKIFEPLSLQAGALEQSHHQSPLFVDGGTFPAGMIALDSKFQNWIFHLDSQAAIPTGKKLSSKSVGKEPTPYLFTEKLKFGWSSEEFSLVARGSHFQFRNLTHGIAQDSRFYGNSISGVSSASTFTHRFEGFESGADAGISFHKSIRWNIGGSYLQNTAGPKNANQGIYGFSELIWKSSEFSLRPKIEFYRNEADSSPAFYTSTEFGHNNRIGSGASIGIELPKAGLNIELKARRSDLIQPRTFQKDRFQFFQLSVEIPYASF